MKTNSDSMKDEVLEAMKIINSYDSAKTGYKN